MIDADRFLVSSEDKEEWLAVRRTGVTATQVAKAATESGFAEAVGEILNPTVIDDNPYMKFGRDNERWIVLALKQEFGIMPNSWLIGAEYERWQMATPDGLNIDHTVLAEVKTTGKDWGDYSKVPIHYRRQVQWQLYVAGKQAEACIFTWLLRVEDNTGNFVPAWFEPKTVIVERDEKMIAQLIDTANRLKSVMEER
jgi:putative phage-type endonuclease